MDKVYSDSINKAKSYYEGFDDVIHDWGHSLRVAENACLIADNVGYKDKEFLRLCALWHDVARTQSSESHEEQSALLAKDDFLTRVADKEIAEKVYEAIRFHKSSATPITIEGKIIRDADKLDIFSVERWKKCAKAGWTKEYIDDAQMTIQTMDKYPDALTYDFTKELFKKQMPAFLEYYESIKNELELI